MNPSDSNSSPTSPHLTDQSAENDISFTQLISTSVGIRLFVDTGVQFFNPFLPIIAAGMRVDASTVGWLVALRSLVGLVAPLVGAIADRHGYRFVMRISLLVSALGSALTGASSNIWVAAIGMAVWGMGVAGFTPTMQAYISSRLPYKKRARGIGILEYSWALAGIVGLFATGYLIEFVDSLGYAGWRAPFFVFAIVMSLSAMIIGRFPSAQPPAQTQNRSEGTAPQSATVQAHSQSHELSSTLRVRSRQFFELGSNSRSTYATIIGSALLFFGAMQLLITHGLWLRTEYGLQAIQLGTVALVSGFADLFGSGMVSLVTDRLGKKRSVLFGTCGMMIGFLLIPTFNVGITMAIAGILLTRGCFEFAIVSTIPLLSEQIPEQRGKVMTLGAAANLTAATIASVTGPWLYLHQGVWGFTIVSAISALLALYTIGRFVQDA